MKEPNVTGEIDKRDISKALRSLKSASFRERFIRTDCNAKDPKWRAPGGKAIDDHVRDKMSRFKREVDAIRPQTLYGGVFQRSDSAVMLTVAHRGLFEPVVPAARDLFHVYGADRDNTGDWRRYYRYAWKAKGPNAIIYSTDAELIRQGKLACNSYAYSGQSSYALAGAGMFFLPEFGDAKLSIRPYVQWLTSASFTGNDKAQASATAYLGIYVESWARSGGGYYVDRDHFLPVWSQNTTTYLTNMTAGGAATVGDGLSIDIFASAQRKYNIFVYAYLETSAGPQMIRNEVRYVGIDIDATVPYVVLEETLV